MPIVAIIGCGPTGLYALKDAMASEIPFDIVMYDASDTPGSGMPYSTRLNSPEMLCNAFSREIPPLVEPFIVWVRRQEDGFLEARGLSEDQFGSRSFFPRTLLGEYFESQLAALREIGERDGRSIRVNAGHRVNDIVPLDGGYRIEGRAEDVRFTAAADHVIIATGHSWAEAPSLAGVTLMSPWPASRLEHLAPGRIGIIGSSLSAIDVALAIGCAHGRFEETGAGTRWMARDGSESLRLTMLSRAGVMPEPDFFYPYPYERLLHLTDDAVSKAIAAGPDGLLDRLFALIRLDILDADPEYFGSDAEDAPLLEDFPDHYFGRRNVPDGLTAMQAAMKEARQSFERKEPIGHRHVLLRASEVLDVAVRELSAEDFQRFGALLRPVLADAYAAVPHRSVARILALHEAGVLSLRATDDTVDLTSGEDGCIFVSLDGETLDFDVIVDARGQPSESLKNLSFPSVVENLADTSPIEDPFRLELTQSESPGRIYCLSMPQLLERYPFAQGLGDCASLARIAVRDLVAHFGDDSVTRSRSVSATELADNPV